MTQAHKLKQAIRARAKKTGESYTIARRQVLRARGRRAGRVSVSDVAAATAKPSPARRETTLGGMSDAKAREKTGHGLEHWFRVLDDFGAAQKGHTAAALHLHEQGVPDWYCQGVTVAYERARGLRSVNQSCTGKFQVSVSRVVQASVRQVLDAVKADAQREAWIEAAGTELAKTLRAAVHGPKAPSFAVREKGDARLRYKWGKSTIEIRIDPRANGKASIVASNMDMPMSDMVEPRREAWKLALNGLRAHLAG